MRLLHSCAVVIATLAPAVLADVKFLTPKAGSSVPLGAIAVSWEDSGDSPSLDALSAYTIEVRLGGNGDDDWQTLTSVAGDFSTGNKNSIPAMGTAVADSTKNGFYLRMISTAKDGGTITNYSDRFTVTGLTGNTPPQFEKAISGLSSTDVPETQNDLAAAGAAAGAGAGAAVGAAAGAFGTPYAEQEGLTKYAPMQSIPPTKITLKGYTPKYPTSSFKVATEALPAGTIVTTITQSQTFSVQIQENTAAAQVGPQDDMAKFLARWKD